MKKSSFLHKPKDMLSKSFNPAKCKTALKLASSRIKLLKNKKENQVNQMKRELAQLLESGQDRTARIRVEHVIREEKMMAAYELIEIYCELVVARLNIIETQKNCPIDLKEAVTSLLFASPRCGDITELLDVRKQFTSKYGKEFTTAAIELRPDCGVSRMLVEKLSARAPDTPAKTKTLTAIAEQHNIKWDPKSFEETESMPPNDLLNGPATFEKIDRPRAEEARFSTPHVQTPSPPMPTVVNPSSNFSETHIKSSHGTDNLASESNNRNSHSESLISQPGVGPSGAKPDTAETGHSNHQQGSDYSFGRQNWNMNFKDAASAAQAAAESAEHASMAARAAAELSNFGKFGNQFSPDSSNSPRVENELKGRQFSGESQKFHEESRIPSSKFYDDRHSPRDSRHPGVQNVQREKVGNDNTYSPRIENELEGRRFSGESQKFHEESRIPSSKFNNDHHSTRDSWPPEVHNVQRENVGSDNTYSPRVENELKGRRFSGESQKFHEESRIPNSKFNDDRHSARDSRPPEVQNVHRENVGSDNTYRASEKSYGIEKRFPQTSSLTSKVSFDKDPPLSGFREAERYSENSLFKGEESRPKFTSKKKTYNDEPERVNLHEEEFDNYDHEFFKEDKITKQSINISVLDDNFVNSSPKKHGSDFSDPHLVNINQDLFDKMAESSSAHHDGGVVSFDDYGSDEDIGSHLNFNDEPALFHPSRRTSPPRFSADTGSVTVGFHDSKKHQGSESLFSTKQNLFTEVSETSDVALKDSSEQDRIGPGPVMFDDSDGPSSDNEADMDHQPWAHNVNDSTDFTSKQHQTSSSFQESHLMNNQRNESGVDFDQEDFGLTTASADHSSPGLGKFTRDSGLIGEVDTSSSSSMTQMDDEEESHNGLNFGKLTGGLRHKGPPRFPFQSRQSDDFSTSSTVMAELAPATEKFVNVKKSEIPENTSPLRFPSSHMDSDSESADEVYDKKPTRKSAVKQNIRSPVRYFDSESSENDEDDSAKQRFIGKSSPFGSEVSRRTKINTSADSTSFGSGVSRRTKANTPADSTSFGSEVSRTKANTRADSKSLGSEVSRTKANTTADSTSFGSGVSRRAKANTPAETGLFSSNFQASSYVNSNSGEGRSSTSGFSATETPPPPESHVRRSSPVRKPYVSNVESNVSAANIENKKSSAKQSYTSEQKGEPSSSDKVISHEDRGKKPSHVHPKLPDYDTIASRLQAIRTNRQ